MVLPYEKASSGKAALHEIEKVLRRFGATSFGVMERFDRDEVTIQFTYREVPVSISASIAGYATAWLQEHPWTTRNRLSRQMHHQRALNHAKVAVYSILRDWIKGQITAVEVGMLSFQGAFLGQMLLPNGETVLQRAEATGMFSRLTGPTAHSQEPSDG